MITARRVRADEVRWCMSCQAPAKYVVEVEYVAAGGPVRLTLCETGMASLGDALVFVELEKQPREHKLTCRGE